MPTVTGYLDDVDWGSFFHSRGSARDMPRHLRALLGTDAEVEADAEAFVDGYSHLWSTIRREGKAWPATAPTAVAVAVILLDDPQLGPDDPSLRDAMLAYLQNFAAAADVGDREETIRADVEQRAAELSAWTEYYLAATLDERSLMWTDPTGLGELALDQASLACFDAVPTILPRVLPHLPSALPKRRVCAAAAVGELARHPSASARRPALIRELTSMTTSIDTTYDLASIVIAIGRLGGDTRQWLDDPRPGVHGSAALAPALANDERATAVLISMSRSQEAFTTSFGDTAPPQHFMIPPQRDLFAEALSNRARGPVAPRSPSAGPGESR
jgi:hypothetical protein